jgi:hypothetical protein
LRILVFNFRIRLNRFTILRVVRAHKDLVLVSGGMKWRIDKVNDKTTINSQLLLRTSGD